MDGRGIFAVIRLGVVGFGKWGRNYVNAAMESGVAEVTHVVLRQGSRNQKAALESGLWTCSNIDSLAGRVDAVVIATHPSVAPLMCESALRLKLPVMVEKPASLSSVDAQRIERAESSCGLPVLIAHQHLFSPAYEALRRIAISASKVSIFARSGNNGPVRDYSALWDYGPHDISMVLGISRGTPLVSCTRREVDGGNSYDLRISTGEDLRAQVTICNAMPSRERKFTVNADGLTVRYFDEGINTFHIDGTDVTVPYEKPLTRAVRAFSHAVMNGGTDDYRFGASWAVRVARAIEAAEQSANLSQTA